MAIEYKRLTQKELDFFIQMRIHQLREEGAKEEIDLAPALKDYYERHMADGTFVSWIAVDGESIIATSGMSFVEKTSILWMPERQNWITVQYVYRSGVSKKRYCKRIAVPCDRRCKRIWMRNNTDYGIGYGR